MATWHKFCVSPVLITRKCQQTAAVGAASSGLSLVPGVGAVVAVTAGVAADIGATFKLQAELVLEVAEAHQYEINDEEKRNIILLVTGVSAGGNQLLTRTGQRVSVTLSRQVAEKWLSRVVPVIGMGISASVNAVSTYAVGQRAHAYFGYDPERLDHWQDGLEVAAEAVDQARQRVGGCTTATVGTLKETATQVGAHAADVGDSLYEAAEDVGRAVRDGLRDGARRARWFTQ